MLKCGLHTNTWKDGKFLETTGVKARGKGNAGLSCHPKMHSTTMQYMILYQTKSCCFVSGYQHNRVACLLSSPRSALYMSELLYTYGQLDLRVCPLVFTIRHWARANQITHSGPGPWISNFTLTLLVLHHLQTTGVVPPLNTLRSLAGQ